MLSDQSNAAQFNALLKAINILAKEGEMMGRNRDHVDPKELYEQYFNYITPLKVLYMVDEIVDKLNELGFKIVEDNSQTDH